MRREASPNQKPCSPEHERGGPLTNDEMQAYDRITDALRAKNPDDLRAMGWSVAVHNDYKINGEPFTFWLFTKGERAVKGEGKTDAEALKVVRERVRAIEQEKFSTLPSYYGG